MYPILFTRCLHTPIGIYALVLHKHLCTMVMRWQYDDNAMMNVWQLIYFA